ncbi:MAG: ribosomal maturation YjgA family protein [Planctomycetota bacterium]|jgi:hypothetical protein
MSRTWIGRLTFLVLALACLPVGLLAKRGGGDAPPWIANHLGGAIYVMCGTFFIMTIIPRFSPVAITIAVLLMTCGVEALQLWDHPALEDARSTRLGGLVLGHQFSWSDFPYYVGGAVVAWIIAALVSNMLRLHRPHRSAE